MNTLAFVLLLLWALSSYAESNKGHSPSNSQYASPEIVDPFQRRILGVGLGGQEAGQHLRAIRKMGSNSRKRTKRINESSSKSGKGSGGKKGEETTGMCACSPSTYSLIFDFSISCSDMTLDRPGIAGSDCRVSSDYSGTIDFVPVVVDTVHITELDQYGMLLTDESRKTVFQAGSHLVFNSHPITRQGLSPRTFLIRLGGKNRAGEGLSLLSSLTFSSSCNNSHVLVSGDKLGWLVAVSGWSYVSVCLCRLSALVLLRARR